MKLITLNGISYKTNSKRSLLLDTIFILPYSFVLSGTIQEAEWAKSPMFIVDRFELDLKEIRIDGRKKEFKKLPYFTWGILKTIKL